jgi:hypothetical protein
MGTCGSVSRCAGDVVGSSFFLEVIALSNVVDNSMKDCHVWGLSTGSVQVVYID